MQWNVLLLAGVLAALPGCAQAQAMEPLQVRSLAASCANCHGTLGVAQLGNESLAGGNRDQMLKSLLDFKTGQRPATVMHQLARGYTDVQLAALAAYFSVQKK